MVCDNYKLTYCKTFTQNINLMKKYQGFDTPLWSVGERGAYLTNSHDECTPIYKVTTEPSYTAGGAYQYWCPICGTVTTTGTLDKLEPVWGDVNGDREFNNTDVTVLLRVLSGYTEATLELNLDPTGDGKTNNRDVIALVRKLAGF